MTTTRSTGVPVRGPGDPAVLLRTLIGQALRRLRQRQGRTLRDVADAAQVSMPYLSEVERGRKEASSEVLAAICRALGVRLSDLLEQVRDDLLAVEPAQPAGRAVSAPAQIGFVPGASPEPTRVPDTSVSVSAPPTAVPATAVPATAVPATAVVTAAVVAAAVDLLDRAVQVDQIVPASRPPHVRRVTRPYFDVRCGLADVA